MDYKNCTELNLDDAGECLIIGVFSNQELTASGIQADQQSAGYITRMLATEDFKGKPGQGLLLTPGQQDSFQRIIILGLGDDAKLNQKQFRKIVAKAAGMAVASNSKTALCCLLEVSVENTDSAWKAQQIATAFSAACYRFDQLKAEKDPEITLSTVSLLCASQEQAKAELGYTQGRAIAHGMQLSKDLANLPGNHCTPSYLAEQAQELAKSSNKFSIDVLEEADMEKLGMGSLLSVSRGSREPAKLIVLHYKGGVEGEQPVALVGKGLTFDAGGISLKPSAGMDEMKYDMCGGASVLGTLKAIAEMDARINVVGIVPSSENLPDGAANKPGDIVTSMAGISIEILNTDAEGRLILCDALSYAERFNPAIVIDIATLTGACVVALGAHISGLMGNDDNLCESLSKAGETIGDPVWRLPMGEEYQQQLKSNFADMANIGGREAGTITAACFLSKFTEKYQWAHLDIAGTAWRSGKNKGATGRPVPLLTQYLLNRID